MARRYILQAIDDNTGKAIKTTSRKTEQAISNWANKMYNLYGENITVIVGYFTESCEWIQTCTYHA